MSPAGHPIDGGANRLDFDRIQRQIAHRAKRLTMTAGVLARWRRRYGRRRGPSGRALLLDHASRLAFERRAELEAMMEGESRMVGRATTISDSCCGVDGQ